MSENLMSQNAPHVRQSESVLTVMTDVIIALVPLYLMSFFYYGARALLLGIFGVICCVAFSVVGNLIFREKIHLRDLTPIVTGLIIPLLMPADIPYYVIAAASAVAIVVVKMPFGGTGNNLFNPAAVGFATVAICWQNRVFSYPAVLQKIEVFSDAAAKTAQSPAYSMSMGIVPDYDILDMFLGNAPGPMGATNILVIVACGIFLIVRKALNWRTPVFFISTCALMSIIFPRVQGSSFDVMCYELFSGMLVFGAFFMLSEPITSPKRDFAKAAYSVISGIVVILFRIFGGFEDGFVFALIIMNVFAPMFDSICEEFLHIWRHKEIVIASMKKKKEENLSAKSEKLPEPEEIISEDAVVSEKTDTNTEEEKEAVLE